MAEAQPIKALANVIGNVLGREQTTLQKEYGKFAFLNARLAVGTLFADPEFMRTVVCEQAFRPRYLELKQAGFDAHPNLAAPGTGFEACLVLAGKFRTLNESMVLRARLLTRKGGIIIVAGAKNTGITSLRKRIVQELDIEESLSKYHSVVFWFKNSAEPEENAELPTRQIVNTDRRTYETVPGLFSADKVDQGSLMLVNHFDDRIGGRIADLGAGWGYLCGELLNRSGNIAATDLYEADWHGVDACKKNLHDIPDNVEAGFYWHDVTLEPIDRKYDWVIMNPPFHQGRETRPDLGQAFIEKAALILRPGGQLLMVANRRLAYERTISDRFCASKVLEEAGGFKVILAKK